MAHFLPGDLVQIRDLEEILATLDNRGTLDGLPFMPEMMALCGETRRVSRRAHKFCIENGEMGGFEDVVFLEDTRCDGSAHKGCKRACLVFWKETWLKDPADRSAPKMRSSTAALTPETLRRLTMNEAHFFCQSSELPKVAPALPWWRVSQYRDDVRFGHAGVFTVATSFVLLFMHKAGEKLHRIFQRFSNKRKPMTVPSLNLRPGELVRVKSAAQIQKTLDHESRNRGMWFTPDMYEYCGKMFRVRGCVDNVIVEQSAKMHHLKNTVTLEGVTCTGMCRRLCTRGSYLFWREAWLERAEQIGGENSAVIARENVKEPVS